MTDLTEQWKKGELPEGHYYIKTRIETNIDEYIQWYKDNGIPSEKSFSCFDVQEVLAPVPSYDEWVYLHKARNDAHEIVESLTQENQQLKEWLEQLKNGYFQDSKTLAQKLLQVKPELREWLEVNYGEYL